MIKPSKTSNFHVIFHDFPRFPGHRRGETSAPRAAQGPQHCEKKHGAGGNGGNGGRGSGSGGKALGGGRESDAKKGKTIELPWISYIYII